MKIVVPFMGFGLLLLFFRSDIKSNTDKNNLVMYEIFSKSILIDKREMAGTGNKVRFQIVFSSKSNQLSYL